MRGLFISFEGTDGCGKSTQMKRAAEYLEEKGLNPLLTREPGGCSIAESIRDILLNPENTEMDPRTEMLLYAAARAQHVAQVIQPAVEAGRIVLSDRFLDSSIAYQGYGRGLGAETVERANESISFMLPDVTFFLDVPPSAGFERMHNRSDRDRLEQSGDDFFLRVYDGLVETAARHPDRIVRIDASGSKDETQSKVRLELDRLIEKRGL